MFVLESPRLTFRHLAPGDLDDLVALHANAEVMRFLGGVRARDASWEILQRIRRSYGENHFGLYAATLRSDGTFVGRCGFIRWNIEGNSETEVAYAFAQEHWGKGFATEAAKTLIHYGFHQLKVRRLVALIHPENVRSLRVAKSVGFEFDRDVFVSGACVQMHAVSA